MTRWLFCNFVYVDVLVGCGGEFTCVFQWSMVVVTDVLIFYFCLRGCFSGLRW